jgi:glutamate-ammonia-ligase adenylyltransferase
VKLKAAYYQDTALPQQVQGVWEQWGSVLEPALAAAREAQRRAFFQVLGNSNFLARWVRRHPEAAVRLIRRDWRVGYDLKKYNRELQRFMGKISPHEAESVVQQRLMQFKYTHLWRITARDMGLKVPFPVIASEISCLAQSILAWSYLWERRRLGRDWLDPIARSKPHGPIPFTLLAMGKLGGSELNFSSDVDLIYLYQTDEAKRRQTTSRKNPTPHEFFCKLAERLGRLLGQRAPGGFLYRMDLELRPEGAAGSLANSLEAMEYYYENFGAFWEKQAMIKASWAAGSNKLFESFHRMIHPFVYPKTSDYSFLEKIQEMKQKVLASVKKSSEQGFHVKLGEGGIREIEFFVQSLQILFGGQRPQLETANTLSAIAKIAKAKIISASVAQGLRNAYLFLRTLENRLQQVEEQQTHHVPEAHEERLQMVRRMGYLQSDAAQALEFFERDLSGHRRFVQATFANLLAKRFGDLKKTGLQK